MLTDPKELTRALGGKWYGSGGRAPCPVCNGNPKNPPLGIGRRRDGGPLLYCWKGCAFVDIAQALREIGLGLEHEAWSETRAQAQADSERQAKADGIKKAKQARMCWEEATPIQGTLAEAYLRGWAITCDLPETLRFHPQCWHGPTSRRYPALVARVDGGTGFAIHRTYLNTQGKKAAIEPVKLALGGLAGGAVRLSEGGDRLAVAEGIETALSLACGLLQGPATIWATLGTSGMTGLTLPPQPGRLTIATDSGAPGREAGGKLAARAHGLGWKVTFLHAPEGLDWNDVLQGEVAQ